MCFDLKVRPPIAPIAGGATDDAIQQVDRALAGAGVAHDRRVYEGAPHSFFDRTRAQHAEASADAWPRVLDFIRASSSAA